MVRPRRQSRRSNDPDRKPHFFKVLLGDFEHRLKIPPKFMKHITKEASRRIILQGPNGSKWQVGLSNTAMGNFMSAGWSNFVKDHCLKEHEFLLFRYEGNMCFHVKIFDTSACEREDVFEMKTPQGFTCERKNKRGRPRKRSLDDNCILQHQSSRSKLLKLLSNNKHASKQLHGPVPNNFYKKCRRYNARQHVLLKPDSNGRFATEDIEVPLPSKRFCLSRRRPVTSEERSKAEEAANSFRSPFPYTISRMTKYQTYMKYILRFPARFSRNHLPRIRTDIILKDQSGKAWPVVFIPSVRSSLGRGWMAFVRANKIEEGDFCAFELIGELELRVHIFRVVEETSYLISQL